MIAARQQPGVFGAASSRHLRHRQHREPVQGLERGLHPVLHGGRFRGTRTNATVPGLPRRSSSSATPTCRSSSAASCRRSSAGQPRDHHRRERGQLRRRAELQHGAGRVRPRTVDALLDSGAPFTDKYMPVCMQQRWREAWGLNVTCRPTATSAARRTAAACSGWPIS